MSPQTSPAVQSDIAEVTSSALNSSETVKATVDEQALTESVTMEFPDIDLQVSSVDEAPALHKTASNITMINPAVPSLIPSLIAGPTLSPEKRPTILVVDDEPLYLELIADILGDDYKILAAGEGMTAMEIAAENVPQLILLDLMMPGIDGFEVYRCLKADARTWEIPVIFITGMGDVATETKGLRMGAVDYINKPINPDLVKARVNTQINLKLMRDKLVMMAATDGLTGLANRFHFDSMLAYEYARHLRSGEELALIMLDLDHFKTYNDTYGHLSGDQCLREVAKAMTRIVSRTTDLVARYGGEEFVVLLPDTCLRGAVIIAERVRNCIGDLVLPQRDANAGHITASLGVVSGRFLKGSSIVDVLAEADIQLYTAKAGGRNRVAYRAIEKSGPTH
jgi:diguanylate cyclase (GGDEF)-like protein